jgi:hypothetical protein
MTAAIAATAFLGRNIQGRRLRAAAAAPAIPPA